MDLGDYFLATWELAGPINVCRALTQLSATIYMATIKSELKLIAIFLYWGLYLN